MDTLLFETALIKHSSGLSCTRRAHHSDNAVDLSLRTATMSSPKLFIGLVIFLLVAPQEPAEARHLSEVQEKDQVSWR